MAAPTKMKVRENFQSYSEVSKEFPILIATVEEGLMQKVSSENLDKISGSGGFKYFGTTAQTSVAYKSLVINTDAVFTSITVSDGTTLTNLGLNGAVTVSAGIYLPMPIGVTITAVTLTSGSAIGYN